MDTSLAISGPYSLKAVALMGFGHRDERSFDGVMRLAFCLDGDYEQQVGVEVRQDGQRLDLCIVAAGAQDLGPAATAAASSQVARVLSVDQDGGAFQRVCQADPVLARVAEAAAGFRPALFYSPYEAAVWSIISARRARSQAMTLRTRIGEQLGATFELAGQQTVAVPTPSQLLQVESIPGLPADRVPRLHAIARAAQQGRLAAARLVSLDPADASQELQQLPGIGPFYSSLILIRSCGATDLLPLDESKGRAAVAELYGWDRPMSDAEYVELAERWRPFRTWAAVMIRAHSGELTAA